MSTLVSLNSPLKTEESPLQVVEPSVNNLEEVTVENVNAPIPLEVEESAEDSSQTNIFERGVNITRLKKYYKWLLRRLLVWSILVQLAFIAIALFAYGFCAQMWGAGKFPGISGLFSDLAGKITKTWLKGAITVCVIFAVVLFFRNVLRVNRKRRTVIEENDLCKSKFYPTSLTPACTCNITSLFSWRLNLFWIGFTLIGVGINLFAAAYISALVLKAANKLNSNEGWGFRWHTFLGQWWRSDGTFSYYIERIKDWTTAAGWGEKKFHDSIAALGLWSTKGGFATILLTNPILRLLIKRALAVFNLNEFNMSPELREKTYQINKRNKILCLVLLCISGLEIYIVLKKLIIAVFNKSFKYSKR